jgi:hypothetical protein
MIVKSRNLVTGGNDLERGIPLQAVKTVTDDMLVSGSVGVTAHTALTDKEIAGVIDHANGSVTDAKLASDSVTNSKILNGAVSDNKLTSTVGVAASNILKAPASATVGDLWLWNGSAWVARTLVQTLGPAWSLDTTYQNTAPSILVASMTVRLEVQGAIATIGDSYVEAQVMSGTPPTTVAASARIYISDPAVVDIIEDKQIIVIVPQNYYFRFASGMNGNGVQPTIVYTAQWQL